MPKPIISYASGSSKTYALALEGDRFHVHVTCPPAASETTRHFMELPYASDFQNMGFGYSAKEVTCACSLFPEPRAKPGPRLSLNLRLGVGLGLSLDTGLCPIIGLSCKGCSEDPSVNVERLQGPPNGLVRYTRGA